MAARRSLAAIPLTGLLVLAGCSQAKKDNQAAPPPSSTPSSTSASASRSASATPKATAKPTLGGECGDLLPLSAVDQALGRPVIGTTSFIRGIAEPNIGRLTYLNCRYGIPKAVKGKPAPTAQLEIGVSLYNSAAQATKRVQGTINDYRDHGAGQQDIKVGTVDAVLLLGYGAPTLVASDGPRTVAITISPALIKTGGQAKLQTLTQVVLDATSSFDGVPGVTATPSPSAGASDSSASGSDSASPSTSPS